MELPTGEIESFIQVLVDTPGSLKRLTAGFSPAVLASFLQPDIWSPVEILAHLRGCAEVWTPSIYRMLDEDRPALVEIHPRQHAKKQGYARIDFHTNLEAFNQLRPGLVERLVTLREEDWQRSARIKGRQHTVFSHIRRMALHEAGHLIQLQDILKILR